MKNDARGFYGLLSDEIVKSAGDYLGDMDVYMSRKGYYLAFFYQGRVGLVAGQRFPAGLYSVKYKPVGAAFAQRPY